MATLIINSSCANLASVKYALERIGEKVLISDNASDISSADRVILPGVGTIDFAMAELIDKNLIEPIKALTCPVLGICLGMQLLFEGSNEGHLSSLGIINGKAEKFNLTSDFSVPHMGWNSLNIEKDDPLLMGINDGDYVYFVHSYFIAAHNNTIASTTYGNKFSAVVRKNNVWGCQFHPERSSSVGAKILKNFVGLS